MYNDVSHRPSARNPRLQHLRMGQTCVRFLERAPCFIQPVQQLLSSIHHLSLPFPLCTALRKHREHCRYAELLPLTWRVVVCFRTALCPLELDEIREQDSEC